jgi:hypothetical protein
MPEPGSFQAGGRETCSVRAIKFSNLRSLSLFSLFEKSCYFQTFVNHGGAMSDNGKNAKTTTLLAAGAVLGVGVGAAVGSASGNLGNGIWIGSVIGVGLGMLGDALRSKG